MIKFIQNWSLFLLWWLFFTLICVGTVIAGINGLFAAMLVVDFTKLTFVIMLVSIIFLLRGGKLAYKLGKFEIITEDEGYDLCAENESTWFTSDVLLTIGMIGTVLGFIFMLGATFASTGALTIPALQAALVKMSAGASAALYTTATGLICGLMLRIQAFVTSQYIDRIARKSKCKLDY